MHRPLALVFLCVVQVGSAGAQAPDSSGHNRTFLNRNDLLIAGATIGATGIVSLFDVDIARGSQGSRFQGTSLRNATTDISKVNETTLTLAGIATYGIARLFHAQAVTDIALHATESVVLASVASQLIRGPLGRTRPYVTHDSDQYHFEPFKGFFGKSSFDNRSFPSIHESSSMAVATVLTLETHYRHPGAVPYVAPLLYSAALLPGLSRIQLDQHWASDIFAGAVMGIMAGYKVTSYSHEHPDNRFDKFFLRASIVPERKGVMITFEPWY